LEDEIPLCPPVAAYLHQCSIVPFQAFLVWVSASTTQAMRRLLALSPNMATLLVVVTLRETGLSSALFYSNCSLQGLISLNILLEINALGKVIRKNGMFSSGYDLVAGMVMEVFV
jgi:hypothetical protein